MRSRHPFPDVPLNLELSEVRQALDSLGAEMTGAPAHLGTIGVEFALGFMPHQGENRRTRLKATAEWQPPKGAPARRELVKQRQKQRRGKLDVELRRLQRKATK